MNTRTAVKLAAVVALATLNPQLSTCLAQSSAFTYQGRLNDSGQPATGIYDLRFTIYDAPSGGTVRGGPVNKLATPVTNGLFTVTLDFGAGAFDGADRWLEIAAGANGAPVLTPLAPRQPITATPYAIRAANFTGTVGDGQLPGNVARLNANQTFTGTNLFNNRVGLGVASPGTSLEINGGLRVRGGSPGPFGTNNNGITFNGVGDADSGISSSANGQLEFYSNSGETMRMQANGYVGIGTNNPQSLLHVAGTVRADNFSGNGAALTNVPGTVPWQSTTATSLTAQANQSYRATGTNTTLVNLPTTAATGDVVRVSGLGSGGWQVAPGGTQVIQGGLIGEVWVPHNPSAVWRSVASSADGLKLVAVPAGGQPVYTSTDGGNTWTARPTNGNWQAVASSTNGSKLIAVEYGGRIHTSTSSGFLWTLRESVRNWQAVASSADGTKLVAVVFQGLIFTSANSGATWVSNDVPRNWYSVASSADGTKLAAVVAGGQIYTSTDSGANWTPRENNRSWRSIASSADGTRLAAVVEGGQIYLSTDSGQTWTPRATDRSWKHIASSDDGMRLVALEYPGRIHTSGDAGATWTPHESSRTWIAAASSADGSRLVALVDGGQIYTSSPGLAGAQGSSVELQYVGGGQWQQVQALQDPITTDMLAAGAVTTSVLADGAVTALKMATTNGNRVGLSTIFNNPTPASGGDFGFSVAAVGNDRVLIGEIHGVADAGAAYLFSTNGTLLTTFNNPTPAVDDYFGRSVAAVGSDRVLIGAEDDDTGAAGAGAAYLFSTNGVLLITFNNPTPANGDHFGWPVAAMGSDRVLIGARNDDAGAFDAGAAYLFSTNGTLITTFNNPTPATSAGFGLSVSAMGSDRVLIGQSSLISDDGAAHLFSTNGTLLATFANPAPGFAGAFGSRVTAVGSDRVLIGASGGQTGGAAYLFSTNGNLLATINNPIPLLNGHFGHSMAAVGSNRVLVGAYGNDTGAGAAYLFSLEPPFTPDLVAESVRFGAITTASLADGAVTAQKLHPTVGVWTASGANVYRAAGNVGIGTAYPADRLSVKGGALSFYHPWTDSPYVGLDYDATGDALRLRANLSGSQLNTDLLTIKRTTGAVGIGTNDPQSALHVQGTVSAAAFGSIGTNAVELQVNGLRALRLEDNGDSSDPDSLRDGAPNVIGGSPGNYVAPGIVGATIGGGGATNFFDGNPYTNRVTGNFGTVSGGLANTATGDEATVGGGQENTASGSVATVGGGYKNTASAASATVGGGQQNTASGSVATVGGGQQNTASGSVATVGGGYKNTASAPSATVGGGRENSASDGSATVGGGYKNTASAPSATVGGGQANSASDRSATVGGGEGNTASGEYATVPGGVGNTATSYAFAAGFRAKAIYRGSFVWGDGTYADVNAYSANSVTMRASGGYYFYSDGGLTSGAFLPAGGGAWSNMSDRESKEDFAEVSAREVLEKVAALPMHTWKYKSQDAAIRHLGPVAQDFHAAFGVGETNTCISTVDADGVALAAIQGLNAKVEDRSQRLEAENAELKQRLTQLEELVRKLASQPNGGGR